MTKEICDKHRSVTNIDLWQKDVSVTKKKKISVTRIDVWQKDICDNQ